MLLLKQTRIFDATDAEIGGEFVVMPKIWSRGSFQAKSGETVIVPDPLFGDKWNDGIFTGDLPAPWVAAVFYKWIQN